MSCRDFLCDRKRDRFRRPQKHYLYPYEKLDHRLIKRYRMLGGHGRQCPIRVSCLPEKHRQRACFVDRSPQQDEIDRVKKREVRAKGLHPVRHCTCRDIDVTLG